MLESTINALLRMTIHTNENGEKLLLIPLEKVLRGEVDIKINAPQNGRYVSTLSVEDTNKESPFAGEKPIDTPDNSIKIKVATEIQTLYKDGVKLAQDVADYLEVVAQCWEYRNLEFKTTILKKVAAHRPNLNNAVFSAYGKEGDKYLTTLVKDNLHYIADCWARKDKEA